MSARVEKPCIFLGKGHTQKVEAEDWTKAAISLCFLAAALNVPFLPTRSMLGSDILKYNPKIKAIENPFEGRPLALVPAVRLDVAFIHAQSTKGRPAEKEGSG